MKEQHQMQLAGLWMDHNNSILIIPENGDYTVKDKVYADHYHGHKGEHAENRAEVADNRKYFKTVAHLIEKYDEVYIFGPGKSQEEFMNFLHENMHFKGKKITLGTSDQVTDPQMIAKVRDFFKQRA